MPAPPQTSRASTRSAPSPAPESTRPHLELVRRPRRLRLSRRVVVTALGAGFAGLLMALVALHVLIAQAQFRIDAMQAKAATEQATYEKLRLGIAQLESPARIVSVAEGRLGMRQPGSVTYLPALSGPSSSRLEARAAGSTGNARTGHAPSPASSSGAGVRSAPSGDANWPSIKPYLSGSP